MVYRALDRNRGEIIAFKLLHPSSGSPDEVKRCTREAQSLSARIKILDFGIACRFTASQGMPLTGVVLGPPEYMAPEQAVGNVRMR